MYISGLSRGSTRWSTLEFFLGVNPTMFEACEVFEDMHEGDTVGESDDCVAMLE